MNAIVRGESVALPSIEKARSLLAHCRSVQEVMHIKALAQAVASCAASEAAKNEALAIMLLSKARAGELTAALQKTPDGKRRGSELPTGTQKQHALEAEGISRKDAAEYEKLAELKKTGDLDRFIESSKAPVTTSGAIALARLSTDQRAEVFARLEDLPNVAAAIREVAPKADSKARRKTFSQEEAISKLTTACAAVVDTWEGSYEPLLTEFQHWVIELERKEAQRS